MEAIPKDVIECALLDGAPPQLGDGAEWCEQHGSCEGCAQDVVDAAREEIRRLKAERDRALAELDKALGEREDAMLSERNAAYNKGYDEGFASADDWYAEHAAELAEHGWVRLPKDADGEYIHIGDRMENNERVARIVLTDGSWEPSVYLEKLPNVLHEYFCHDIGHYHAPTVEDVLEELLREYDRDDSELTNGEIIERFAAKLRLADE